MEQLTLDTVIDFKMKGATERFTLSEIYNQDTDFGSEEAFFEYVRAWIKTGRAIIVDQRTKEEIMADKIADELMSVNKAKAIEDDRIQRQNHSNDSLGIYSKVGFPAKTLLDAQELQQMFMRNFALKQHQLGVESQGNNVMVTITDCPIKTYTSISKALGLQRATETVTNTVSKTANTVVNGTDMVVNSLATPIAKTAISTGTKIGKSLFGFAAKIGGIAISEVTKATKQCVTEIKSDGYIAEAKGEVIDGMHSIRRAVNKHSNGLGCAGGQILE